MVHPLILAGALQYDGGARCRSFANDFPKVVACERARGTLRAFESRGISWRVRYYVRYWEMPCGEFPTVEEAYVFHTVTNDLYNDPDLTDADRIEIRNVMFVGATRCP